MRPGPGSGLSRDGPDTAGEFRSSRQPRKPRGPHRRARHASQPVRDPAEVQRHTLSPRAVGAPSLRRDTAPAAARTTALPTKVSPRSPEELIALLKRLPNSVSREESTSDVSVRFYQALRWDLDQIRDVITPRIMQYATDQVLIDRLVEFNDASRKLKLH